MESPKTELREVGKAIREALDDSANPTEQIRAARAGLLDRVAARNAIGPRPGWLRLSVARRGGMLAALGALSAAAVALGIWMRLPISFQVGQIGGQIGGKIGTKGSDATGAAGRLDDVVEGTGGQSVAMSFSEGSSIVLDAGARARVLSVESAGARVLLENGSIDVAIAHRRRRGTRWSFEAGPFHVLVTGTKFRLAWNPNDQSLALAAREGSVLVSGSCLETARAVKAGDSLRFSCLPRAQASATTASPTGATPAAVPLPALRARPTLASAARARDDDSWQELVAAGHLTEGLRAAERANFNQVCRTASEGDLLALADAARLSGHTARAVGALTTLRQRFPSSPDAATAAFSLGRIAFERRGAYPEAVRWFTAYLAELPQGPLMGDAVGRLMEARQRAGDRTGARADAEQYLHRFPEGPYAPEARAMLSE
jgi:transmembrane sensor